MQNNIAILAMLVYIGCVVIPARMRKFATIATILAWCCHGLSLAVNVHVEGAFRLGFAIMWSVAIWVSVLVYLVESRSLSLDGLRILILPQAVITSILPLIFPGSLIGIEGKPLMFPWHIGVAILAYSTLTIAAFHALVMYIQDLHLHRVRGLRAQSWLDKALDRLPALLKMEHMLFMLIKIGFAFLTLTVLSGVIFSEQFLGVAFKWDHKTILSLVSWLLFAVLLTGRSWKGWRGKTVLRVTLFGFVTLLLAYVGSRFVLEVLLHRSV